MPCADFICLGEIPRVLRGMFFIVYMHFVAVLYLDSGLKVFGVVIGYRS